MDGNNNENNLVSLTAREHYIAHWLLHKTYPYNDKLIYALNFMIYGDKSKYLKLTSKEYENIKILFSKAMSENMKGKKHPNWGQLRPFDVKEKISNTKKEYFKNLDIREKQSNVLKEYFKNNPEDGEEHSKKLKEYFKNNPDILVKNRLQKTCKSIKIDGIKYQSIRDACRILNMNRSTIKNRLKSSKFPNYKYI